MYPKGERTRHILLAFFFLALSLNLYNYLSFRFFDFFSQFSEHLIFLGTAECFLIAPLLWLYIQAHTSQHFHFTWKKIFHLLPYLIFLGYLIIRFHLHSPEYMIRLLQENKVLPGNAFIILTGLLHVQILIYTIFIIRRLVTYRNQIRNIYSSYETVNFNWVKYLIGGISIIWLMDIVRYLSRFFIPETFNIIETILFIMLLIFSYLIIYKSLHQPQIFSGIDVSTPSKQRSLSEQSRKTYLQRLSACMQKEKPYLIPDITLMNLAEKTRIPPRSLSEVINQELNKNFYDFINYYRVKEAVAMLKSEPQKTILAILLESGFNSKSSFHVAFRKYTGKTPTQIKSSLQNVSN